MPIEIEPWGGIAVWWPAWQMSLLVEPFGAWLVLAGHPVCRVPVGSA
jgi:hypothetical protein